MFQIIKEILVSDKHNLSKYNFFHLLGQKYLSQSTCLYVTLPPNLKLVGLRFRLWLDHSKTFILVTFLSHPEVDMLGSGSHCGSVKSQSQKKSLCNSFQTDTCQWLCFSSLLGFLYIMAWCVISGSSLCNRFPRLILKYSLFNIFFAAAVKSTDQRLVQREKRKLSLQCVQTIRRHQDL